MAKKMDSEEVVTFEELLMGNTIVQEALVALLERKGLITEKELLREIIQIKRNRMPREND